MSKYNLEEAVKLTMYLDEDERSALVIYINDMLEPTKYNISEKERKLAEKVLVKIAIRLSYDPSLKPPT
ncbi:MAG: hypothetical protein ACOC22_02955 [bacterium]